MPKKKTSKTPSAPAVDRAAACSPPLVLVVPLDMPDSSLAELRAAGFVPVKTDKPEAVKIVAMGFEVQSSDMLMAAMHGVVNGGYTAPMERFTRELFDRMKRRESEANTDYPETISR